MVSGMTGLPEPGHIMPLQGYDDYSLEIVTKKLVYYAGQLMNGMEDYKSRPSKDRLRV